MDKIMMKKRIADEKLKAFTIGTMGNRPMSKKEQEELKKKQDEEAAAEAFQEFVETFEQTPSNKVAKTWIKAGTYDAGKRREDSKDKGKIYRPQPKIDLDKTTHGRSEEKRPEKLKKKKDGEKKKSNLEIFKEELKIIQTEREERQKYKGAVKNLDEPKEYDAPAVPYEETRSGFGSFDTGDPTTTNIYLGNINPKITEQQLMEVFGKYGPLASIKIMWPRSEEEKARGRNCGFVAYMSRRDGERALKALNGKEVYQFEMKLGWGKAVPLPQIPVYIPPKLVAFTTPPAPSGLPFNAQLPPQLRDTYKVPKIRYNDMSPEEKREFNQVLEQSVVKVIIPSDRGLLSLIHRMIEFVVREGPIFEALIMNKEIGNPQFRFLFENESPAHIYYRWKLFSILQGDGPREWKSADFRMFKGGSLWRPPQVSQFLNGMPEELIEDDDDEEGGVVGGGYCKKGSLSVTQRERLEQLLRNITPQRKKIAEAMVFCVEHADAVEEISDCLLDSLSNPRTALYKKVARLYLVSDVLHNCGLKGMNASTYRKVLESRLPIIFEEGKKTMDSLSPRGGDKFRNTMLDMLKSWNDIAIYPRDTITKFRNIFMAAPVDEKSMFDVYSSKEIDEDLDGAPLSDSALDGEDLDGIPLDGATLLKGAMRHAYKNSDGDGGVSINSNGRDRKEQQQLQQNALDRSAAFVPSRWESVDPEEAEAQAMTTSKWELMTLQQQQEEEERRREEQQATYSPVNASNFSDDRRAKLREVEVKVVEYQDELESGERSLKGGYTVQEQVEQYRHKLLRKIEKQEEKREYRRSPSYDSSKRCKRRKSESSSPEGSRKSFRSKSRSKSPLEKSHRMDYSPRRRKRSRSPLSPAKFSAGGRYREDAGKYKEDIVARYNKEDYGKYKEEYGKYKDDATRYKEEVKYGSRGEDGRYKDEVRYGRDSESPPRRRQRSPSPTKKRNKYKY